MMRILYRQREASDLSLLGVEDCYLKELCRDEDGSGAGKNFHHHREYELHIPVEGEQVYEMDGKEYRLSFGAFLLIPPFCKHRTLEIRGNFRKYSLTFRGDRITDDPRFAPLPEGVAECLQRIREEKARNRTHSAKLIENRTFEILLLLLRRCGLREDVLPPLPEDGEDARLNLAKKYLSDNADQNLSLSDIAAYCHLSPRHLSRLFLASEGISPVEYLRDRRLEGVCTALRDTDLPLKQICQSFGFSNEYYFNAVFCRRIGMPPGAYRKMHRNK